MTSDLEQKFLYLVRVLGLPEPLREYQFAKEEGRRYRFDFSWANIRVAAELEGGIYSGGRHVRGKGFENDCRKYNLAAFMGWTVFRFTAAMLDDVSAVALLETTVRQRSKTLERVFPMTDEFIHDKSTRDIPIEGIDDADLTEHLWRGRF